MFGVNLSSSSIWQYFGYGNTTQVQPKSANADNPAALNLAPLNNEPRVAPATNEPQVIPAEIHKQWLELFQLHHQLIRDDSAIEEFILFEAPRTEANLQKLLQKLNSYLNHFTDFYKEGEWQEALKKVWEKRSNLLRQPKPPQSRIRKNLLEMFFLMTNHDSLKAIVCYEVTRNKPTTQNEAKKLYLEALDNFKIWQADIVKLLGNLTDNSKVAEELKPMVPQFELAAKISPFEQKQSLEGYFLSQNIAGLPEGLDDIVVTIAAAYSPNYQKTVQNLSLHPERGMILHGPPGTGKTVMAKAIGEYLGCPSDCIKITSGSNLLNKWMGETERSIRELFLDARKNPEKLYFIIIDEIDAILTKRSEAEHSWQASPVTQFLTELDGIDSARNTFVIGITNYVDRLDPAAIRPGRLGGLIEVPLPNEAARERIFHLYLSKIKKEFLKDDYEKLSKVLARVTEGFSGAEMKASVQRTSNNVFMKMIRQRHFDKSANSNEFPPMVILERDFLATIDLIKRHRDAAQRDMVW